jgi:hypothetical protein
MARTYATTTRTLDTNILAYSYAQISYTDSDTNSEIASYEATIL